MSKIFLVAVLAVLPGLAVAQHSSGQPAKAGKSRSAGKTNPCAIYGPGFVKIEGSNTCIKIGGGVTVEAGSSVRH